MIFPETVLRDEEVMRSGHAACPGCGVAIGMRMVLRTLGKRAVVVVVPSCVAAVMTTSRSSAEM